MANSSLNNTYEYENGEYYDDYDYSEYVERLFKVEKNLWLYYCPVLIFGGTLGNLLGVLTIVSSRALRRTAIGFTLAALALVDIGVLNTGALRNWILFLTDEKTDVRLMSLASCKIHSFATLLFMHLSSWTIALLTTERAISVWMPFRAQHLCTRQKVGVAWVVLGLVLTALDSHFFWSHAIIHEIEYYPNDNYTIEYDLCIFAEKWKHLDDFKYWMDLVLLSLGPGSMVIGGNCLIIASIVRGRRRRNKMAGSKHQNVRTTSTTVALLLLSVSFIVTTLPLTLYLLEKDDWFPHHTSEDMARLYVTYAACLMLYYMSNAMNLLLYMVTGQKFRRSFMRLLLSVRRLRSLKRSVSWRESTVDNAEHRERISSASQEKTNSTALTDLSSMPAPT